MNREKTRVSMLDALRLKYISCVRFLVLLRVTLTPPFPRIVIFFTKPSIAPPILATV